MTPKSIANIAPWLAGLVAGVALLATCSQGNSEPASGARDEGQQVSNAPFRQFVDRMRGVVADPFITVPEGTVLAVRLVPTLSTKTHRVGDTFEATLVEAIVIDGKTAVPRGARVWGQVVESDDGGRVQGVASLAVQLTEIESSNGERVGISTTAVTRRAKATKTKDAQKIGIGAGVGAAIGAIAGGGKGAAIGAASGAGAGTGVVLATHGKPAVLPSETVLKFALRHEVTIS